MCGARAACWPCSPLCLCHVSACPRGHVSIPRPSVCPPHLPVRLICVSVVSLCTLPCPRIPLLHLSRPSHCLRVSCVSPDCLSLLCPPIYLPLVPTHCPCPPVPTSTCPSCLCVLCDHLSVCPVSTCPLSACPACPTRPSWLCIPHVHLPLMSVCRMSACPPLSRVPFACLFLVPRVPVARRWSWAHECLVLRTAV